MKYKRMVGLLVGLLAWIFSAAVVEADATPPGPVASLMVSSGVPSLEWEPLAGAETYDVVLGDVGHLRFSGGDFSTATRGCAAAGTVSTSSAFDAVPDAGQGFWVLVRGNNNAGAGTYDSSGPSQAGSRDAEIAASPSSCGYQPACGDGSCNGVEGCSSCPADCGGCECTSDAQCQPASCCHPMSCITIWEPQSCDTPICEDGCWYCLNGCACQDGMCVAF